MKVLFILAAIALVIAGLEFVNSMSIRKAKPFVPSTRAFVVNADCEFVSSNDEGSRFERRVLVDGHAIRIRIAPRMFDLVKPVAEQVVSSLSELMQQFDQYKVFEAERNPQFASEIRSLKIGTLSFASRQEPNLLEVVFTEESGGAPWIAFWDQNRKEFRDLRLET